MKSKLLSHVAFAGGVIGALAFGTPLAQAGTITPFSGQDNGAPLGGPFPNSIAAQTSFLAAAATFGTVSNHGFEGQPLGFQTTAYTFGNGDTFTINAPNFGPGGSGISNTTFGNLFGFSIGGVNNQWLGFPDGSVTFNFAPAGPTHSFGAFFTGLQNAAPLTISFNDGTDQLITLTQNTNGGAQYFGFTDTAAFSILTISNLSGDAWGLDRVSFNAAPTPVPIPAAGLPFGLILASGGLLGWWRRQKTA